MKSRERFLSVFAGQPTDRPPAWIMRQAGRYLPEYRALKEKHDFLTLVKTPELATEVSLQPLRRFPLDAAIIFSDILIIPEALGQPYRFRDGGGIEMEFVLRTPADIQRLNPNRLPEKLKYLPAAIRGLHSAVGSSHAILGFGGAPWTLATYMVEGGSSKDFAAIKALYFSDPAAFDHLLQKITSAVIEMFREQINAGVDAIQIFDSWGSAAAGPEYWNASLQWIQQIVDTLGDEVPIILFAKGMVSHARDLCKTGAAALAVDPSAHLPRLRSVVGKSLVLQGNLDPILMTLDPEIARQATSRLIKSMQGDPRFIFNLGHGITPEARIDTVTATLRAVRTPI